MNLEIIYETPEIKKSLDYGSMLRWADPYGKPFYIESVCATSVNDMTGLSNGEMLQCAVMPIDEPYIAVIVKKDIGELATFGYCHPYFDYRDNFERRPLIVLSMDRIRKYSWFLSSIFAGLVLRHELGHAVGLMHHRNPFCIMSKPNLSFGRFCKTCMKSAQPLERTENVIH